jgi:hypothetical protein
MKKNVISPRTVMRIFSGNCSSLRTAKQRFLCMHIIRFTQCFQLITDSKPSPFLFLPNANLNTDFQKCIVLLVSQRRPRVLVRATHWLHTSVHRSCMTRYTTPWYRVGNKDCTDIVLWCPSIKRRRCDNASAVPNFCINTCNESSRRSTGNAADYYNEVLVSQNITVSVVFNMLGWCYIPRILHKFQPPCFLSFSLRFYFFCFKLINFSISYFN